MKNLSNHYRKVFIISLIIIFSLSARIKVNAQSDAPIIFDSPSITDVTFEGDDSIIRRSRLTKINFGPLGGTAYSRDQVSDSLQLNLFEDVNYQSNLMSVSENRSGSVSWIGTIEGVSQSQVFIVIKDGVMLAHISLPGRIFEVHYVGNDSHIIEEIDQSYFPDESDPVQIQLDPLNLVQSKSSVTNNFSNDDGSIIDTLVVYTQAARSSEGGTTAIQNLVDLPGDAA